MIAMDQTLVEGSATPNNSARYLATAMVNGQRYEAQSRHGACFELARLLTAAGIPDQAVECSGILYGSLHRMATRTLSEGATTPLRNVRWHDQSERWNGLRGEAKDGGEQGSDASLPIPENMPLNEPFTHAPEAPLKTLTQSGNAGSAARWGAKRRIVKVAAHQARPDDLARGARQ